MDAREQVVGAEKTNKNRKRGSESVRKERKRLKLSGLPYKNYKNIEIPAKKPPVAEVST